MYRVIAFLFFACCTPVFSGCAEFGKLSPDAQNALSAAGRIAEKAEPCLRSLLSDAQASCKDAKDPEACKSEKAGEYIERQKDRDTVADYLCEHPGEGATFAGECAEEPKAGP